MSSALVRVMVAPVMAQPGKHSECTDEVLCGMRVEVLEINGNWRMICSEYQYSGWVEESCLVIGEAEIRQWDALPKMVVRQAFADVLAIPSVRGYSIGSVTRGSLLSPTGGEREGWKEVRFCDGRKGWIWGDFLSEYRMKRPENEQTQRRDLTETACSYLGVQYRWGGKTPLGIDCSGLCSMSYLLNGVYICRDSHISPAFTMREIPYEQRKTGDLLFFPGHVAMLLDQETYIHSTASNACNGVVCNSLNKNSPIYRADLPSKLLCVGSIF